MATLNYHANNVLGEFGFLPPEHLLAFEDVKREFIRVRALEMQKLGIADTNKTVTTTTLDLSGELRTGTLSTDMIPAFVEIHPTQATYTNQQEKIEVVPLEEIASYEGSRAIAFYGTPLKYKLAFDAWEYGNVTLYYDAIEDYTDWAGDDNVTFPPNFYIYLECKTALSLADLFALKLAYLFPNDQKEQLQLIMNRLDAFKQSKLAYTAEWQAEFKKWKNQDLNQQPRLRRTQTEIWQRNYNNVTGFNALGYIPPQIVGAMDEDITVTVDGGTP